MAKIARKTQLIFGSSAGAQQIGQFGSLAANDPTYTTDPAVIQALANYLTGWYGAVVGINSPAIQDMNALCYLYAYQLAYAFQAGISEWDSGTTYYTGSWCQVSGVPYVSLSDSNLNNNPTSSTTNWQTPVFNGVLTKTTVPLSMTLVSSQVMSWPMASVGTGVTITVPSGARWTSEGSIIVSGTGVMIATGTGIIRVY